MKKLQILAILSGISLSMLSFLVENESKVQEKKLREISKLYKYFDKSRNPRIVVSDSSKYKWTISLCVYVSEEIMGYHYERDSVLFSKATGKASLHGNKLYQLYVSNQESYYNYKQNEQPIGQAIVKETWNIKEVDSSTFTGLKARSQNDGKWYSPTNVSQLFIMYKEKPSEYNDKGWVYGIVDIEKGMDSLLILSKGNISSCISCHRGTKYDRMFGRFN